MAFGNIVIENYINILLFAIIEYCYLSKMFPVIFFFDSKKKTISSFLEIS